jgi:hypothetical protein
MKIKTEKTVTFSKRSIVELTDVQLLDINGGTNGGGTLGRTGFIVVEDAVGI